MNGCLLKTLMVLAVLLALFITVPYIGKYASDSVREKIDHASNTFTIIKKFYHYSSSNKKNDDSKNKETTK